MTETADPRRDNPYQWSYEAHQKRQVRLGQQLTPAERLHWLESTVVAMKRIQGRARDQSKQKI